MLSFGSLGQANTFCSKVPNISENLDSFNFFFQCDKNYFVDEVYSVGLLGDYETNSFEKELEDIQTICYQEDNSAAGKFIDF